ncbi:MAG: Maf family protein, partial [Verrucomicrobiota bacterium]
MTPTAPLILASESPRRRELLAAVGVPFRVVPSGVDEIPRPGEAPARFARRAALDKGEEVAARHR